MNQPVRQSSYKQILSLREVHLMAFYILVYVGVEVTIGGGPRHKDRSQCSMLKTVIGWIVTYLIHERGGGSSSGYVSSGFFGGWSQQSTTMELLLRIPRRFDSGSSRPPLGEPQSWRKKGCVHLYGPGDWVSVSHSGLSCSCLTFIGWRLPYGLFPRWSEMRSPFR